MTATLDLGLSLEELIEQQLTEPCRFCGCTETTPCTIFTIAEGSIVRLARPYDEPRLIEMSPCAWFLPGVCNAPECIEKLIEERKGRATVLYGANGERVA
jgi:hypothetical protein